MSKKTHFGAIRLLLANLFAGIFLSWYTVYLMKSTVNWWGAGSMRPGFFWMSAFPWLIILFAFLLWAFQKALLQSWRDASFGSLFLSGALFLSPFLFNILPYWQGNLEMPFTLSLIIFGWSLPIVFLRNRQEQEKQLWRDLREARKAEHEKLRTRENHSRWISSYKQKTGERTMRQEHPIPFFIGYQLTMSLATVFGIAFFIFQQPYYGGTSEMDVMIRIWRDLSEIIPQWLGAILFASGILSLLSFGAYGLIRGRFIAQPKSHTALYTVALTLGIGGGFFLLGSLYFYAIYIFFPGLIQCLILSQIELRWRRSGEKQKNLLPQKNPLPLHLSYHIIMALLIAFSIAFLMLHDYSMNQLLGLNFFQQIWRTFSYVLPQWYGMIFPAAAILGLFAFGTYGLVRGSFLKQPQKYTALYGLALVSSLAIFMLLFGFMFHLYGFYIIIPGTIQCLILSQIELRLSRSSEKAKHNL